MFKWMRENDECTKKSTAAARAPIAAPALPNAFVEEQQKINKQLLEELKQLGASVNTLIESNKQTAEQSQQSFERMPKTDELVSKIEAKLQQHRATEVTTVAPVKNNDQFEQQLMQRLGSLSDDLAQLRNVTAQPPPAPLLAPVGLNEQDKAYMQELKNDTLNALAALKTDATEAQQKGKWRLECVQLSCVFTYRSYSGLRETTAHLQQSEANILADLKQLVTDVGTLNELNKQSNDSRNKITERLEALDKYNSIILANSNLELETQRKIEFVTLQIVQQISKLVENQIAELTGQIHKNFTDLNDTVISTQLDTKRNVSESMETALEQVWHQITIMGSELNQNKKLLELMQTVHIGYVNATFSSMSGLSNKVDDTKNHMIDMDTNLNFLLGKLSLMSSEFANIKQELADALDDLRNSFQMVQEQMPNSSSGKQNMDKSQYLTQVNLLDKRHAQRGQE